MNKGQLDLLSRTALVALSALGDADAVVELGHTGRFTREEAISLLRKMRLFLNVQLKACTDAPLAFAIRNVDKEVRDALKASHKALDAIVETYDISETKDQSLIQKASEKICDALASVGLKSPEKIVFERET